MESHRSVNVFLSMKLVSVSFNHCFLFFKHILGSWWSIGSFLVLPLKSFCVTDPVCFLFHIHTKISQPLLPWRLIHWGYLCFSEVDETNWLDYSSSTTKRFFTAPGVAADVHVSYQMLMKSTQLNFQRHHNSAHLIKKSRRSYAGNARQS